MGKVIPNQPLLIALYGFPGAGKTHFARQFCEHIQAAHIQGDRIRAELFEKPRYDKQENDVITQLMNYMTEEFLNAGISVVYDVNAMRSAQRHGLRTLAHKAHAEAVSIWLQMDPESAFQRSAKRDRRRADDKYAAAYDRPAYGALIGHMQNPLASEDAIVVSGKHPFNTQFSSVLRRMRDLGLVHGQGGAPVIKPGMVNLVPQPHILRGRVDNSRRNIMIR